MKSRNNFKKRLISVAIASVLTGLGSHAAANDFTIENGALTISNGAFNQAVTVGVNGIIPAPGAGVPLENSFGIPNFTFNLVNEASAKTNGDYVFKVGVVIDDDNSDRRIEAYLGMLNMSVTNGGDTLTGSIPAQDLVVIGRDDATNVTRLLNNGATNGPISVSGGSVSFNGATLVSRLRGSNVIFDAILDSFNSSPGHYTYSVVIEKISGPDVRFGLMDAGSFSPLPQARTACTLVPSKQLSGLFQLLGTVNNNAFRVGEQFSAAYAVQGQFSVVGAAGVAAAAPAAINCAAPVSADGSNTTDFETEVSGTLPSVSDADGTIPTYSVVSTNSGTFNLTDSRTGAFTYTPADGFSGDATVVFRVSDGTNTNDYNYVITVDAGNTTPTTESGTASVKFGGSTEITLTGADADVGDTLTFSIVTQPTKGTLSAVDGNKVTYTANVDAGSVGDDTFTFIANDGTIDSASSTVTVTIDANTVPTGANATFDVFVGQQFSGSVTGTDADGNPVTFTADSLDGLDFNTASGGFTYTPSAEGQTSFTYTVTDSVGISAPATITFVATQPNRAPVFVSDSGVIASTRFRKEVTFAHPAATDADNDSLTYTAVNVNGGTVVEGLGVFTYIPDSETSGPQDIVITVSDPDGEQATGAFTIDVGPPIPPVATISVSKSSIVDTDGAAAGGEQGVSVITATASDADGSVASVNWTTSDGQNFTSTGPLDLAPSFDFPTDGDKLITMTVTDDVGLTTTASTTLRILPRVFPTVSIPTGNLKVIDRDNDGFATVSVTGVATDLDGPELKVSKTEWLLVTPEGTTVIENATGLTASIAVPVGANNTITFRATDTQGLVTNANIKVEVVPPKSPVVTSISGVTSRSDSNGLPGESIPFSAAAIDEDGTVTGFKWFIGETLQSATGPTATLQVPDGNQTITVVAVDNDGRDSAPVSTTVNVKAAQSPQISILGGAITANVGSDTPIVRTLTANAFDPDSNVANVAWTSTGSGISIVPAGNTATVTITPPATGSITATVTDGFNLSNSSQIAVNVALLNLPVVNIVGGSRTVDDTDTTPGAQVEVSATATATQPAIGGIINPIWQVGSFTAPGLTAALPLEVGPNTVTFTATAQGQGGVTETRSTSAVITVKSLAPNDAPTLSIASPGSVPDTDGEVGETVTFTANAIDPDFDGTGISGPVSLIRWSVNGTEVLSGADSTASLALADGENLIEAVAIDKLGAESATAAFTVNVGLPSAPTGFVIVGPTSVNDTNGRAGETVTLSVNNVINTYPGELTALWSVDDVVIAEGLTTAVPLTKDGLNAVTLTLRNSIGRSATAVTEILVAEPVAPVASIVGGSTLTLPDSDSRAGETVSLFGSATDADGPNNAVATVQWLLGGEVISNSPALDFRLGDNPAGHVLTFRAVDTQGLISNDATVTVTVPNFVPPATSEELDAGASAQRKTANDLEQLLTTNPQAAAEQARAAAAAAAAEAEKLRRSAQAGSASNAAIASGLGAMSQSASTSTRAGAGSADAGTRSEINQQARQAVQDSGLLLSQLAENSANSGLTLTLEEEEQIKQASSNLLDTTADIARNTTNTDDLLDIVNAANRITESNQQLGIAASPELVAKTAAASLEIATKVATQVLSELGSNLTEAEVRAALGANPNALQSVIDAALKIPPSSTKTADQKNQEAAASAGANPPPGLVDRLKAASGVATDPSKVVKNGVSALDAILGLFGGGAGGLEALTVTMIDANGRIASVSKIESGAAQIKVDDVTGLVTLSLPGETYAGAIVGVKSVPDTVPTGIRFRADGRGLIVNGGFAIEIAPAPISLVKFINAVERSGFPFRMNPNASITLEVGNGERFSGTFAYDNLTGIDLAACGDLSFIEPTGALNSAGYAFGVRCANGAVQHVVPFIESSTFNDSVRAFGLTPSMDRNTGFVTVPTVGVFKPNFFVLAPTAAERVFHAANKDAFGNAVQYLDANGDGKLDVKLITATGTQLLYGVN